MNSAERRFSAQQLHSNANPMLTRILTLNMTKNRFLGLGALAICGAITANALPSPYPTPGAYNSTSYSFTATGNGNVTATFVGETAGYGSEVGMSVNGKPVPNFVLQNHSSSPGDSAILGSVMAGDIITFVLIVSTTDRLGPNPPTSPIDYTWSSDPTKNADGINHIYSAPYAGDLVIPAGTYVGFEDLPKDGDANYGQDFDYDDHQFVFTGPFQSRETVPDGGSTALLLGLGSLSLAALRARRK